LVWQGLFRLEEEIIKNLSVDPSATVRDVRITTRRSVLLFGPPGTSKTTVVRTFAKKIGWKCVEITPSDFLRNGMSAIYQSADAVFNDLADLEVFCLSRIWKIAPLGLA
jgi:replication-associated recombination protein RarA